MSLSVSECRHWHFNLILVPRATEWTGGVASAVAKFRKSKSLGSLTKLVSLLRQDAPSLITARFVSTRAEAIEIAEASPVPWSCLFPGSSYKGTVMARGDYGLL
eukprot:1381793-Amphidinium_carterae.1